MANKIDNIWKILVIFEKQFLQMSFFVADKYLHNEQTSKPIGY